MKTFLTSGRLLYYAGGVVDMQHPMPRPTYVPIRSRAAPPPSLQLLLLHLHLQQVLQNIIVLF